MIRHLVIVTFGLSSFERVAGLVEGFEAAIDTHHRRILIVDNAGSLKDYPPVSDRFEVMAGSNSIWEFSGWIEGLKRIDDSAPSTTITLMNDSYGRNWEVTAASRSLIRRMYRDADGGKIAAWLDNFSHFRSPFFSRRVNSRLMVIPSSMRLPLADAVAKAADRARRLKADRRSLFDAASEKRLLRWMASQGARWDPATQHDRLNRIFIEHHLLDALPRSSISYRPRSYFGSLRYAVHRRLTRERR